MKKRVKLMAALAAAAVMAFSAGCAKDNPAAVTGGDFFAPGGGGQTQSLSAFGEMKQIESVEENHSVKAGYLAGSRGVLLTGLSNNSGCIYNYAVDLNEVDGSIIEFEILHDEEYDASSVEITLTDIYDESNFISVNFAESDNPAWSVITAKNSAAINYMGVDNYGDGQTSTAGFTYYYNNFNCAENANVIKRRFNFNFDPETGVVGTYVNDYENVTVLDMKNGSVFDENSAFKGFTTGQVYMRIEFKQVAKKGGMLITALAGKTPAEITDISRPNENLKFEGEKPEGDKLHPGSVGYVYALPAPVKEDMYFGEREVAVSVKDAAGTDVSLDDKYSFTPSAAGSYVAGYAYTDNFGNQVTLSYAFEITAKPAEIYVTFEEVNYILGETVSLPEASVRGGSGALDVETVYTYNGNPVEGNTVQLSEPGSVRVETKVTDAIGYSVSVSETFEITNIRLLTVSGTLPFAVKRGEELTLPDFTAFDYVANAELAKSIEINGQATDGLTYEVTESGGETLNIVYYGGKGTSAEVSRGFTVNVIDPAQSGDLAGYFIYDGEILFGETEEPEPTESGIPRETYTVFTAERAAESTAIKYAYPLSADYGRISLHFDESTANYSSLIFTLSDYEDRSRSVSFSVSYEDGNLFMSVMDGTGEFSDRLVLSNYMQNAADMMLYYDNATHSLLNHQYGHIAEFEYDTAGNPFTGFESGAFLLEIEAMDIEEGAAINVRALSNQEFSGGAYERGDRIGPSVYMFGDVPSFVGIGEKITVPRARGFDVLGGECEVRFSLYFPEGSSQSNITSGEMTEPVEVTADAYGQYVIELTSYDKGGNRYFTQLIVSVADKEPPEISVENMFDSAEAGKEIVLPSAIATDNYTAAEDLEYMVVIKDGLVSDVVDPGANYTFAHSGTFRVIYVVRDAAGNQDVAEFTVTVS